jgi:hypothetical protein
MHGCDERSKGAGGAWALWHSLKHWTTENQYGSIWAAFKL